MYITLQLLFNKGFTDLNKQGISCIEKISAGPFGVTLNRKPMKKWSIKFVGGGYGCKSNRKMNTITGNEVIINGFLTRYYKSSEFIALY